MSERKHIHLDLLGGLAGDMFLAAAIDAGLVTAEAAQEVLRKVGLGPVEVVVKRLVRGAIEGTHVSFAGWDPRHDSDHRHLSTIQKMLRESELPPAVVERALELFDGLGRAEATVHGIELERVHFHEVGAVDSLLDFVAAAWIIEESGASWSFGEIPVGSGTIQTAHGEIPVPAPATAKLLEGLSLKFRDVEAEFVTPTGAAILAALNKRRGPREGRLHATGFGCGTRDMGSLSNVVRLVVLVQEEKAEAPAEGFERDQIVELRCEIDDESPEITAYVVERLFEAGAREVVREPVYLKKGRLGTRLTVLAEPEDEGLLVDVLLVESSTFGVRREVLDRWILKREVVEVDTFYGTLRVKLGWKGDEVVKVAPEYEDCAARAREAGVPLSEVFEAARRSARGDGES